MVLVLFSPGSILAATYSLADFAFSIVGTANDLTGTLKTNQLGVFSTESEIEEFFNDAIYSVRLEGDTGVIAEIDDSQETMWDLILTSGATATLETTPTEITLEFSTPVHSSASAVLIWSNWSEDNSTVSVMEYAQSHDTRAYVVFSHNVMEQAFADLTFGQAISFPAVPEPHSGDLMIMAVAFIPRLRGRTRRRSRGGLARRTKT